MYARLCASVCGLTRTKYTRLLIVSVDIHGMNQHKVFACLRFTFYTLYTAWIWFPLPILHAGYEIWPTENRVWWTSEMDYCPLLSW